MPGVSVMRLRRTLSFPRSSELSVTKLVEGAVSDGLERVREVEGDDARAPGEGVVADLDDRGRQHDFLEVGPVLVRVVRDLRGALPNPNPNPNPKPAIAIDHTWQI